MSHRINLRHSLVVTSIVVLLAAGMTDMEMRAVAGPNNEGKKPQKAKEDLALGESNQDKGSEVQWRSRVVDFTYKVTVMPKEHEKGTVRVFLPVPRDTSRQDVLRRQIDAPIEGDIKEEHTYGNLYWYAQLPSLPEKPMTITAAYRIRRIAELEAESTGRGEPLNNATKSEESGYKLFLKANRRVPVDAALIGKIARDIGLETIRRESDIVRAIYNYVIDTMEYKKIGTGWGQGDTYWACTKKYGNCTDYHALFTSLARNQGVPVQFKIGFPVPLDRQEGEIGGYHCWLNFASPKRGWVPIDASEADKHPDQRELLFGSQPPDRIAFTRGRDLKLGPKHKTGPLNYFIYPHIEVGEQVYDHIRKSYSFSEVSRSRKEVESE